MPSLRVQRVQSLLRAEISTILQRRLKDPRVSMVTLTSLEVTPDLRSARVWVSVYAVPEKQQEALEGLQSAAGFIRAELMRSLHLRPIPTLEFHLDESLAQASRTYDLLEQIRHEHEDRDPGAGPGGPPDSDE